MYDNNWYTKPRSGAVLNSSHFLSRGLMSYYLFNEGNGTIANDLVNPIRNKGTLNNFELSGSTSNWVGSSMGGGLHFDATNDLVNVGYAAFVRTIDYNIPWSFSCNFNLTSLAGDKAFCGIIVVNGGAWNGMAFRISPTGFFEYEMGVVNAGHKTNTFTSTVALVAAKDYQVTLTYDGQNLSTSYKLYVNGGYQSVTATTNVNASIYIYAPTATTDWYIGNRNYSAAPGDMPFNGRIDQFMLWNRELNSLEATKLYTFPNSCILSNRSSII